MIREIRKKMVLLNNRRPFKKEVREYLEEAGADVSGMTEEELEEASEVFALSGGRYLIVEG